MYFCHVCSNAKIVMTDETLTRFAHIALVTSHPWRSPCAKDVLWLGPALAHHHGEGRVAGFVQR